MIEEIAWCIVCGLCFFAGWMTGKGHLFTSKRRAKDDKGRSC